MLYKPHDTFFRMLISKIKNADDLFKNALPKEQYDKIDKNSIKLAKGSFAGKRYVSNELSNYYTDMVFNMKLSGKDVKVAVLVEHKAQYDKFTLVQMHKYISLLWNEEVINNASTLTPIIPILVYHGERQWDENNNMDMCFEDTLDDEFKNYIPRFDYVLYDLSKVKNDEIRGNIEFVIAIRTMKHIFEDIVEELKKIFAILEEYVSKHSIDKELKDFLECLIAYINKSEDIEPKDIYELVDRVNNNELREVVMTLEKKFKEEGRVEGREVGRKEGREVGRVEEKIETATKMKKEGLDVGLIAKITGLSKEKIEKL